MEDYSIGLYRKNAIVIESEASDSDESRFARKDRNLHCDVRVAAENKHTLLPCGSLDSFWITAIQTSR